MININLLPADLKRSTGPDVFKIASGAILTVGLLTMAILQISASSTLANVNRDIETVRSELAVLQPRVREHDQLTQERAELLAVASVSTALTAAQTSWSADLAKFVRQLPSASSPLISLTSLTMQRAGSAGATPATSAYDGKPVTKEVAVNGSARSSAALVRFVNTFEQAPDFGVQFQNANKDAETGVYAFVVTVGMIGSAPPQASSTGTATPASTPSAPAAPAGGTP